MTVEVVDVGFNAVNARLFGDVSQHFAVGMFFDHHAVFEQANVGANGQAGLKSETGISAHLIAHDEGTVVRVAGEAETIRRMRQIEAAKSMTAAQCSQDHIAVGVDLAGQFRRSKDVSSQAAELPGVWVEFYLERPILYFELVRVNPPSNCNDRAF